MAILTPSTTRLSPHFLLSDLMGSSTIYTKGLANVFDKKSGGDIRLTNLQHLCEHALEPILALNGAFSIGYGFISPEVSRETITYQDWRKPSHHRADLGAAVDILPHHFVLQSTSNDASPLESDWRSPIAFALEHLQELPLSRLITYSESPYICIAVSAEEVQAGEPRMAWYENRYEGKPGAKPLYLKYPSKAQRDKALYKLSQDGLPCCWEGGGFPSYHGTKRRQLHHIRVSKNTVVTDWLYDEEFMCEGIRNLPSLNNAAVWEGFQTAGRAYDKIIKVSGYPRASIVSAYTSHLSEGWMAERDWRSGPVSFEIVPPEYVSPLEYRARCMIWPDMFNQMDMQVADDRLIVTVERGASWPWQNAKG